MRIFFNQDRLRRCTQARNEYEIVLTPAELAAAYTEHKRKMIGLDIGQALMDFVEDAGAEDRYCEDWSYRCGESWSYELKDRIEEDDHVMADYMDRVRDFAREKLKGIGIDPDTMEKGD